MGTCIGGYMDSIGKQNGTHISSKQQNTYFITSKGGICELVVMIICFLGFYIGNYQQGPNFEHTFQFRILVIS